MIDVEELAGRLGRVAILDVRDTGEYDGSLGYSCDPRQGHIPGAVNLPVGELLDLDEAALAARLGVPAGAEIVVYCHSGSRSSIASQVLRSHGYNARNYEGSWHEWSRTEFPLEV
jgi:thiosulfate/3-mercaptopyruvate sulfurtransferase